MFKPAPKSIKYKGQAPNYSLHSSSGQALIIILLVLAVAGTLVLSLVSRTITDIAITTKEKEASRAFSAAEAGIERALLSGSGESGTLAGGETYTVQVSGVGEGLTEFPVPQKLSSGDIVPIWFVSHAADGSLTCADGKCFKGSAIKVCWGEPNTDPNANTAPAAQISVIYTSTPGNYATVKIARAAHDPNSSRRASNNFSPPDGGSCQVAGIQYAYGKTINFADLGIPTSVYDTANGLQTARIKLIYNTDKTHPVGVAVSNPLPAQGKLITSTGQAEQSTRKIEVFRLFPDLPPIFDFGLFSTGSLVK